jgi:group I intron endonuclease
MGYIYEIINSISGKKYIGQSIQDDIEKRWRGHRRNINTDYCPCLYSAFRKYGIEHFIFRIICICFDDSCDELERYYISRYNTIAPNGYNLDSGGTVNKMIHAETKEKIRNAHLGKKHSESRKQKNRESHIGYRHTEISKEKMSLARKGVPFSQEIRDTMSKAQMGHKVLDSTKRSVGEANKRRIWTEEMKQKLSNSIQQDKSKWKGVEKYSKDNKLIAKYNSIKEASECSSVNRNSIAKVCYGQRKTGGGFIWKFI